MLSLLIATWKCLATSLETLGRGLGEYEDFSIATYISLLKAGIPGDPLHMVYVKARMAGIAKKSPRLIWWSPITYPSANADPLILD